MSFSRPDLLRRSPAPDTASQPDVRAHVNATASLLAVLAVALGAALFLPLLLALPAAALLIITLLVARRRDVADLAAGLTLLIAAPYSRGEHVRLYSRDRGEWLEAQLRAVHPLRTSLDTTSGRLAVRNVDMLRGAPRD